MYTVLIIIHVLVCLFLIGVVLLQQGKGADMGAVFGGSSQTLFGSGGAGNFLTRLTGAAAVIFLITSLGLAYTSARRVSTTIFDDAPITDTAPAVEDLPADGGAAAPAPQGGAPAPQAAPEAAAPEAAAPQDAAPRAAPAAEGGAAAAQGEAPAAAPAQPEAAAPAAPAEAPAQ